VATAMNACPNGTTLACATDADCASVPNTVCRAGGGGGGGGGALGCRAPLAEGGAPPPVMDAGRAVDATAD
jgi:hypothetical protein